MKGHEIFKHWFVDFKFPNEDGKPHISSGGEMVNSELGAVLEGWQHPCDCRTFKQRDTKDKDCRILGLWNSMGCYCILSREMTIDQTNYGLKAKFEDENFLVFFSIANFVNQMKMQPYGTVFDTIATKTFKDMKIPIPPKPVIKSFDDKVSSIMNQVLHNLHESSNLATIRDAPLPKLMSWEIRVLNNQKNKRSSIT